MTPFGILWLALTVVGSYGKIERLVILTLLATLFDTATVFSISDFRWSAQDITCFVLIVRFFMSGRQARVALDLRHGLLFFFLAYVLVGGLLSLALFDGYEIESYSSTPSGDWFGVVGSSRIELSIGFFVAVARIALYSFAYFCIVHIIGEMPEASRDRVLRRAVGASLIIVLLFGIYQYSSTLGLFDGSVLMGIVHTEDVAETSAYWNNYTSLYSVFAEPSQCGPWLMGMGWALILKGSISKRDFLLSSACFIEGVLTFSSTALVTFVFMFCIYLAKNMNKNILIILIVLMVAAVAITSNDQVQRLLESTFNKLSSGSGLTRIALIGQAHQVFIDTYGLGLGLNEVIGMSLISTMLAQVGVIGTMLFAAFLVVLIRRVPATTAGKFVRYFFVAIIISLLVSSPGLLYANGFWFALYLIPFGGTITVPKTSRAIKSERMLSYGRYTNS